MSSATPQAPQRSVGDVLALVALGILLGNVGLIGVDVLARWLFNAPQSWVSDIGQVTYPVALACSFPAALESGHMISIRFLGEWLGERKARPLDLIGHIALAGVLVLFTWKMLQRAQSDWTGGFRTANIGLRVAPTWFFVAMLLAVSSLVQVRVVWRALVAPTPGAAHG